MKIQIVLILFFSSFLMNAQKFSGKATYKTHQKSAFKLDSAAVAKNPGMQKMIQEKLQKMYQKTYTLEFNQAESTYKEKPKLNSPNPKGSSVEVMVMSIGGGSAGTSVLYKNIKEQRFANKTELMSKRFLVKDKLPNYDWELTGETKSIGKYTVYKAIWSREVENVNISMVNGETKEEIKKENKVTTAWYTTDIPISNGPNKWGGLPGLILEINDGKLTIVCTEIELNPKNKIEITEPTKGKVVSQEKYEKISKEKSKEFMDRYKSRDGKGVQLRIGG